VSNQASCTIKTHIKRDAVDNISIASLSSQYGMCRVFLINPKKWNSPAWLFRIEED
jgi:hypothetical protein